MQQKNCLKTCRKIICTLRLIFNHIIFVFGGSICRATKYFIFKQYNKMTVEFLRYCSSFVHALSLDQNPTDEKAEQPLSPADQIHLFLGKDFLQFITFCCFPSPSPHIIFSVFLQLLFHLCSASTSHIMQFQHDPARVIFMPEAIHKA